MGHRAAVQAALFGLFTLLSTRALAGEIKFGAKALETDDQGKLTANGRNAAVSSVENVPGEDEWVVFVWAKLDRPAVGPLYVEFWDKYQGKPIKLPWRHEEPDFQGDPHFSAEMTLPGGSGFNKDHTYTVIVTQVDEKGRDLTLAKGSLKLTKSASQTGEDDEAKKKGKKKEEGDEGGEEEEEQSAQDALDSFAPGAAEAGGDGDANGPPPVEEPGKKRGCAIGEGAAGTGVAALFVVGIAAGRRRRGRSHES